MATPRNPLYRWPAWMPRPLVNGYTAQPEDRRASADLAVWSQFRVEFDTDESTANCSLFLDSLEANWFEAFERDLLKQGGRWFLLDLWVAGRLTPHRVRFRERPRLSDKAGPEWVRYSFRLDVFRREGLMSKEEVVAFYG